jgi:hypothetical protein
MGWLTVSSILSSFSKHHKRRKSTPPRQDDGKKKKNNKVLVVRFESRDDDSGDDDVQVISPPKAKRIPWHSNAEPTLINNPVEDSLTDVFRKIGMELFRLRPDSSVQVTFYRKFVAAFGVLPFYAAIIWKELWKIRYFDKAPSAKPVHRHLMMCLFFLKGYHTEFRNAIMFDVDPKTLRRWSWYLIRGIASLEDRVVCCHVLDAVLFYDHFIFSPCRLACGR